MTATVVYEGELRTSLTHLESKTVIQTDAPKDNHGKGEAFSPTDLVATALGACMLSVMGIYARQHNLDLRGATASVQKNMEANPRRIASIDLTVEMPANNFSARERSTLEHVAQTCPVANSLSGDLKQNIQFVWL